MSSYQINYTKPEPISYVHPARVKRQSKSLRKGESINLNQAVRAMASR